MLSLLTLLAALLARVDGDVHVHRLPHAVEFTDLYGSHRSAEAAVGCFEDGAHLWLGPGFTLETLVHEMAHVYDCLDNGAMDASPTRRPAERPAWASDYCWYSDAEWYACSVVHHRAMHPHEHWDVARQPAAAP